MTKYSKEELVQCICECMAESLPDSWESAYMEATIRGNKIDSGFRFSIKEEDFDFKPKNIFAPLNAAKELHSIMNNEGNGWDTITVKIKPDGNFEIYTK